MKNTAFILIILGLTGFFSCQNEEWEFPDFDFSAVYFPYQSPVRTLVLGDYQYDNENDNNLKFLISAHLGGMYNNTNDQTVDFIIDQNLMQNLMTSSKDTLEILPSSYYTINSTKQFIIPEGKFHGGFEVQLNDAFLDDPMSYQVHYILPVRILSSSMDSILSGNPSVDNPDRRVPGNWSIVPKDYTLFGVKFINQYHGKYMHRGKSVIKDGNNAVYDEIIYREKYVEKDEIWALKTIGRNKVTLSGAVRASDGSPGNLLMDIEFNESTGDCVITNSPASEYIISGTGKFVKDGDAWGNKKRNAIYLSYQIYVDDDTHYVTDTLVVRDRDVRFETFVPVIY